MKVLELFTSAGCPRCGSAAFKVVKTVKGAALTADRRCKACGTSYLTIPAPVSEAVNAAMYLTGVVLILYGVLVVLLQLAGMPGPGVRQPTFQLYTVVFSFLTGFSMLKNPHQIQQYREKRLQDYKASAPPDAPPLVEISRLPDAVSISILVRFMSLVPLLISTLLTVVIFGVVPNLHAFKQQKAFGRSLPGPPDSWSSACWQ